MKFGVVSYEHKYLRLNGNETQNMGDWVQTIAMETLYREFGITNYIHVSRNNAHTYSGEDVILPFSCFNTLIPRINYRTDTFPLSPHIIPIFWSTHLHDRCIPDALKSQLLQFGPVGCRDEETFLNMEANHIPAFLTECITALLPQRNEFPNQQTKILAIDIPRDFDAYIPSHLRSNLEYHTNNFVISRTSGVPYMTDEESLASYYTAKRLLNYIEKNAKLVITGRLHIASPCMAMGIPVILVKNEFDSRFSWIDKFLPLYSRKDWSVIDWSPQKVQYEKEKAWLKDLLKQQLFNLNSSPISHKEDQNNFKSITSFFSARTRADYNSHIRHEILSLFANRQSKLKFAIWGVVSDSLRLCHTIYDTLSAECISVYDKNVTGTFEGIPIQSTEEISSTETNIIFFVVPPSAHADACAKLQSLNLHYVLVDMNKTNWKHNF